MSHRKPPLVALRREHMSCPSPRRPAATATCVRPVAVSRETVAGTQVAATSTALECGSDKCRRRHGRMQLTIDPKMTAAMEVSDGAGRSCGSAQARRPTVTVEMMAGVRGVIWLQRRVH